MIDSMLLQEGHVLKYSNILPVPWILVMLLVARLVPDLVYAFWGTVLPHVICNAVEPCLKTDSIFGIYDIPALGNYRMNHHWICHTVCLNNCFPPRLKAPNKHECLCEPVTVTIGLFFLLIHTFLMRIKEKERFI